MFAKKTEPEIKKTEEVAIPRGKKPIGGELATIGPTITVRGDIEGDEDLLVHGTVDGTIDLKENKLMIGEQGKLKATVCAKTITVSGEVEGDLNGSESVTVTSTGKVKGTITAPRVSLEDGSKFKGSIDMEFEDKAASNVTNMSPRGSSTTPATNAGTKPPATPPKA